jgi:hypothetical protein
MAQTSKVMGCLHGDSSAQKRICDENHLNKQTTNAYLRRFAIPIGSGL